MANSFLVNKRWYSVRYWWPAGQTHLAHVCGGCVEWISGSSPKKSFCSIAIVGRRHLSGWRRCVVARAVET